MMLSPYLSRAEVAENVECELGEAEQISGLLLVVVVARAGVLDGLTIGLHGNFPFQLLPAIRSFIIR